MLRSYRNEILKLASIGDEIGIHIHTFIWDSANTKWKQTRDPILESRIVNRSLGYFEDALGFSPLSVRMGWNAMSNEIMEALDQNGIMTDASAIPGDYCKGKFGGRDNFYDWRDTPQEPYHPSHRDYKTPGGMNILEVPISTLNTSKQRLGNFVDLLSNSKTNHVLRYLSALTRRIFNPNSFFYISPWWSASIIHRIMDICVKKAKENTIASLIGFFHPSAIFEETAENEKEHGKVFFKFLVGGPVEITATYPAGVIGTTLENLKAAAKGEKEEWGTLYPNFAEAAEREGFKDVAEAFRRVARVESYHERRYLKLAANVEREEVFKKSSVIKWKCRNCGYVHEGAEAPSKCPACAHPQSFFEVWCENY